MRTLLLFFVLACFQAGNAQTDAPLQLRQTIQLGGVSGKFDHFAIDLEHGRLFAAATGNHSVEVIDLATAKIRQSLSGLGKPHGLLWDEATGSLYVADGSLGELRVYKGYPLALAGTLKLSDDADDMAYDRANHLLLVGHGGSDAANPARVALVDTERYSIAANLPVATHPEALEIDPHTQRAFVNVAESGVVAVIGTHTRTTVADWKLTKCTDNVPLAFDGVHQLLFVACRKPGTLLALDASSGKEVASAASAGGADDLFYDAALHRVYLISGEGEVDTYQLDAGNILRPLGVLHTSAGARTALFVPAQNLLYIGVPGTGDRSAEIRVYSTTAR